MTDEDLKERSMAGACSCATLSARLTLASLCMRSVALCLSPGTSAPSSVSSSTGYASQKSLRDEVVARRERSMGAWEHGSRRVGEQGSREAEGEREEKKEGQQRGVQWKKAVQSSSSPDLFPRKHGTDGREFLTALGPEPRYRAPGKPRGG
eukprot:2891865-Rhodomonas_salina.1